MILINKERLEKLNRHSTMAEYAECITVHSYEEYLLKGGQLTKFQLYSKLDQAIDHHKNNFLVGCDMASCGIEVDNHYLNMEKKLERACKVAIMVIFKEPYQER